MKNILKIMGISAAGLATYLYVNKKDPKNFFKNLSTDAKESFERSKRVNDSRKSLQKNVQKLQQELKKSTPVIEQLQKDINDFQFKISPRIDMIKDRINHLQK